MTCPNCSHDVTPSVVVQSLTICPNCLRTLFVDGDVAVLATGAQTTALSDAELAALRALRKGARSAQSAQSVTS